MFEEYTYLHESLTFKGPCVEVLTNVVGRLGSRIPPMPSVSYLKVWPPDQGPKQISVQLRPWMLPWAKYARKRGHVEQGDVKLMANLILFDGLKTDRLIAGAERLIVEPLRPDVFGEKG